MGIKVQWSAVFPLIPTREYDYQATVVDGDGDSPVGCGNTPESAVAELADIMDKQVEDFEVVNELMPVAKELPKPPAKKRPRMYAVIGQMYVPGQDWVWTMSYPSEDLVKVRTHDFGPGVMGRINQSIIELPGEE
jgi:hypothetical protein